MMKRQTDTTHNTHRKGDDSKVHDGKYIVTLLSTRANRFGFDAAHRLLLKRVREVFFFSDSAGKLGMIPDP